MGSVATSGSCEVTASKYYNPVDLLGGARDGNLHKERMKAAIAVSTHGGWM